MQNSERLIYLENSKKSLQDESCFSLQLKVEESTKWSWPNGHGREVVGRGMSSCSRVCQLIVHESACKTKLGCREGFRKNSFAFSAEEPGSGMGKWLCTLGDYAHHGELKMTFYTNNSNKEREVGAEVKLGKGKQASQGDTNSMKVS